MLHCLVTSKKTPILIYLNTDGALYQLRLKAEEEPSVWMLEERPAGVKEGFRLTDLIMEMVKADMAGW